MEDLASVLNAMSCPTCRIELTLQKKSCSPIPPMFKLQWSVQDLLGCTGWPA